MLSLLRPNYYLNIAKTEGWFLAQINKIGDHIILCSSVGSFLNRIESHVKSCPVSWAEEVRGYIQTTLRFLKLFDEDGNFDGN